MDSQLLAGKRVLVIEDEMLILMALEDMLADLGCTAVIGAASARRALDLIELERFDLATLDLNLDGRPSYDVARALARKAVPFAFCTGSGRNEIEAEFGDRPVLDKPFKPAQLVEIVKTLLTPDRVEDARSAD